MDCPGSTVNLMNRFETESGTYSTSGFYANDVTPPPLGC